MDFVDPVHEALKLISKSSLIAIQHSMAGWDSTPVTVAIGVA